jgi:hypothetical protein
MQVVDGTVFAVYKTIDMYRNSVPHKTFQAVTAVRWEAL